MWDLFFLNEQRKRNPGVRWELIQADFEAFFFGMEDVFSWTLREKEILGPGLGLIQADSEGLFSERWTFSFWTASVSLRFYKGLEAFNQRKGDPGPRPGINSGWFRGSFFLNAGRFFWTSREKEILGPGLGLIQADFDGIFSLFNSFLSERSEKKGLMWYVQWHLGISQGRESDKTLRNW